MNHYYFHFKQFNTLKQYLVLLVLILLPAISLAYTFSEPVERNDWQVEYLVPPDAEFRNVKVLQAESGSIYITGRVRRDYGSGQHGGYVTVALFSSTSSTAGFTKTSPYLPLAGHHRRQGEYFRIDIPLVPNKTARIVLEYVKKEVAD